MPEPSILGKNLRRLRIKNGFDQLALAAASGVPQSTISGLEVGRRLDAHASTARALAGALNVPVDELLDPGAPRRDLSPDVRARTLGTLREVKLRLESLEEALA